uniref:Transcriptional regulator, IclR family n=1 Tax=Chelativorans sp. (strain BNC1) TaxID=266779 RepID=Q11FY0_CHESB
MKVKRSDGGSQAKDIVAAFSRGLRLIEALAAGGDLVSPSELAGRVKLDRAVVRRLLMTLDRFGYVTAGVRGYRLAPMVRELAFAYLDSIGITGAFERALSQVSHLLGETVSVSVSDGDEMVVVARADMSGRRLSYIVPPGTRFALAESASGVAWLSGLSEQAAWDIVGKQSLRGAAGALAAEVEAARSSGFATRTNEYEMGQFAIACPIPHPRNRASIVLQVEPLEAPRDPDAYIMAKAPLIRKHIQFLSESLFDVPGGTPPAAFLRENSNEPAAVASFERGVDLISRFGSNFRAGTIATVARENNLDRAVARRLLKTLVAGGYAQVEDDVYSLTARILRLGFYQVGHLTMPELFQPQLERLALAIDESTSAYVLDNGEALCIARSDITGRRMGYMINKGSRLPLAYSASGRVLLSTLPEDMRLRLLRDMPPPPTSHSVIGVHQVLAEVAEAGRQGYAISNQELDEGMLSMAVLVRDRDGNSVGTLGCSSHVSRMSLERLKAEVLPKFIVAANELSRIIH